jgi:3',5'-cyclic AMP phosphodiesterase CpdA
MADLDRPWLCLMGNHDHPGTFAAALEDEPCSNYQGSRSYRLGDWRVLCIDTSLAGRRGGFFDHQRADALAADLAADPHAPTMIAMHHPPLATGVEWIDPADDAAWIDRFAAAIAPFSNVRHIICGHAHMAVMAQINAPQLWPEMAPYDADQPDNRVMVYDGEPGFALHHLGADSVRTTFAAPMTGHVWLRHDKPLREGVIAQA